MVQRASICRINTPMHGDKSCMGFLLVVGKLPVISVVTVIVHSEFENLRFFIKYISHIKMKQQI